MVPERQWPPASVAVNQAIGVTAEELNCTVREAFAALVDHAEATGRTLDQVGAGVVNHQGRCRLEPNSGPTQRSASAARLDGVAHRVTDPAVGGARRAAASSMMWRLARRQIR